MKTPRILSLILPAVLLCGCLEVEQHPKWINGEYAGKRDERPAQTRFHGDRLAWAATIANRNHLQNEYGRTGKGDVETNTGVTGLAGDSSGNKEANATRPSTASPTGAAPAQASPPDAKRAPAAQAKP